MMKGDVENEDRGRELWFEHKLPDGRVYFSHPVTRKTTWDRPQNAQINPHPAQQGTLTFVKMPTVNTLSLSRMLLEPPKCVRFRCAKFRG